MPAGVISLLPMIVVALAAPIVLWGLPRGASRRLAAGGLASLFLAHAGLYVLYFSRLACWILVGLAALVATIAALPHRRAPWLVAAGAALALGLAFQTTPGDAGIVLYVGAATPLLLGASLALLASTSLGRATSWLSTFAAVSLALFAGLIPLTSFWPVFLLMFEPFHLAPLTLAVASVAILAAARPERPATWGEIAARATLPVGWARAMLVLGALLAAGAGALVGVVAPFAAASLAIVSLLALRARPARLALLAGIGLGLAGLVAGEAALEIHVRGAEATLRLVAASLGASALTFALAIALGAARDEHARDAALGLRGLPANALVVDGEPTPDAVRSLAARVEGEHVRILRVQAPADDPWWTLPPETYDALLETGVHAAIVEGAQISIVPPVAEVEGA